MTVQTAGGGGSHAGHLPKSNVMFPNPEEDFTPGNQPDTSKDIGLGVFDPEQAKQIDKMGSDVKNLLGANVMSQMYIKTMQMGLDTFLMIEKFKYEIPVTILSFSQTMGQMIMGVFNKMKNDWEKAWSSMKEQNDQMNDQILKLYRGG